MAGGAATNAGIEFHQRAAAFVLAATLTELDLSPFFGYAAPMVPTLIKFEGDTPVDDFAFACQNGDSHFVQAKRSLSLSEGEDSEFGGVIRQFVEQFLRDRHERTHYWLLVGSGASKRIRFVLKSLLDAVRLNPNAANDNPATVDETEGRRILLSHFDQRYEENSGGPPGEQDRIDFMARMHVIELNVEASEGHEAVALAKLANVAGIPAELLWAVLVTQALAFSKDRLSVTAEGLTQRNQRFLAGGPPATVEDRADEALRLTIESRGVLSTSRDFLVLEGWPDAAKVSIVELFRFDEACEKKLRFSNDHVEMRGLNHPIKVSFRSATMSGMERLIDEAPEIIKDRDVLLIPANSKEDEEATECAKAHRVVLERALSQREHLLRCVHCGRPISEEWADLVELDDADTEPTIGLVHGTCRRPIDRVLGRCQVPWFQGREVLRGFDFEKWLVAIVKGQRLQRQLVAASSRIERELIIAWGGRATRHARGGYCVAHELDDGSLRHTTTRGWLDRFTQAEAVAFADRLNTAIAKAKAEGNPAGYTSETWTYGHYEQVLPLLEGEERFVECRQASVVPYTEHIAKLYQPDGYYYAPVMVIRNAESHAVLSIGDAVLMVTNPFRLGSMFDNWRKLIGNFEPYELDILGSDEEFDEFMSELERDEKFALVDPLFSSSGELLSGMRLVPQSLMVKFARKRAPD